jgi:hypothetical protein
MQHGIDLLPVSFKQVAIEATRKRNAGRHAKVLS